MSELEDLLRRSFAERSADIVAGPELIDRARSVRPTADHRPWLRAPALAAAAAAAVVVLGSAWLGLRPDTGAPPGRAPVPVPTTPVRSTEPPLIPPRPLPTGPTPAPTRVSPRPPAASPSVTPSPGRVDSPGPDPTAVPPTPRPTSRP